METQHLQETSLKWLSQKHSLPQDQKIGKKPEAEQEGQVWNYLSPTHSLFPDS